MYGLQCIRAEGLRGGFALLVGLGFFPTLFQRLNEQRAVLGIFRFTLGGVAKGGSSGGEIAGLHSEQSEIKRIVVFVRIEIGGAAEIGLRLGGLTAARAGNGKIIQYL